MRILLIAPDQPGIHSIQEIRQISGMQLRVAVLNGTVTKQDVFEQVEEDEWDVIHFASHGSAEGIALSAGAILTAEELLQVVRKSKATAVFFNACSTAKLGSFLVQHAIPFVIATTVDIPDASAWHTPLLFYSDLRRQRRAELPLDIPAAYLAATSGDGTYLLLQSIFSSTQLEAVFRELKSLRDAVAHQGQQIRLLIALNAAAWVALAIHTLISWSLYP